MPRTIYLAVSLDVEEEGLFCGVYARRGAGVSNTRFLTRLAPLLERGVRPTLFCAHSVLADAGSRRILEVLRDRHGAEIGAHLHHWNTPPLELSGDGSALPDSTDSVPSCVLPEALFAAKLKTLFDAARDFQGQAVTSFRMGRWDLHKKHWPLLAKAGVLTDASVRPLHGKGPGSTLPDHFDAPSDPYWIPVGGGHIFEAPLTVTPLLTGVCGGLTALAGLPGRTGRIARRLQANIHCWGALALLPAYHPLAAMKAVTRIFAARGGMLLSLTWHSSEMAPGATPHLPDGKAVRKLLDKVTAYVDWLGRRFDIRCLPMNELRNALGGSAPILTCEAGDWTTAPQKGEPQ